ncbi:toll-like receptor 7 [Cimex lectularius]|uniref:TIR domain-containing protein n=1 Tax=Cimex lectularius TaxID=79782 RepID=A0A8I6RCN2_CIMLE|nr:toll-like receptor 7 [Cimex lectularius]
MAMLALLSAAVFATLLTAALTKYETPEQCTWAPETNDTSSRFTVTCTLRTLASEGGNFSHLQVEGTVRLKVECSDLLLFESPLPPRSFRRLHHLEELNITNCKILEIPTDAFDGLRDLKLLSVRTRNTDWGAGKTLEMTTGSFDGLRQLQTLEIVDSNVRSVPENVFCTLGNLQTINFTRNSIRDVDSIGFMPRKVANTVTVSRIECSGGTDLRTIDVSYNDIRVLPPDSGLTGLRRLQNLFLQNNDISEVTSESFNGLTSLRVLNLSSNKLESLPENLFASTRDLREIHLQNNSLYELARGLFHRLEQLLVLDLSVNQLSSNQIDDGTFVGLIRLIILNLSHNTLTRIDARTFKDLFFLQILDLRNNSIGFIEDNAFLPLYNLHTLNIAENRLHHITAHLFNGLFVLSKLTLNNNLIVNIDSQAFKNCSDLKELDLSSNAIQEVPEALSELSFLKTLDLGENQISSFRNGSFKNLNQLTGLRLIDNEIGNLTRGMFWDLTGLQVLNLAKNKIQQIERGTFERNTEIEAIRLDANFLTDINGVFTTLASLLWLNLSGNHLVWFDYAFVPSNLKWLDIHGNYIERLANYYKIQDELHVKTLDASHNRITELNDMSIPNSVEVIFINNNFISSIQPNTFFEKTHLARADIYANELTKLELNALRLLPVPGNKSLPEFYLGGNPFNCDCSMDWLPLINNMTQMRQYPRVMDLENVMCRMTYSRGTVDIPTTEAKPSEFVCKYETHCFALCHCCDFDACDCEMTCPTNCSCYHDQTWNTNVVDCSRQNNDLIPRRIPMDATHVYLDGNNLKELQNHVFIGRKNMRVLFVNASKIETIQNRTFNGLNTLQTLHLEDNLISELKGYEFEHLSHLRELYLQNNLIAHIGNMTLAPLRSLEILRMDGNRLTTFAVWQLSANAYLVDISLGSNQWSCKCKFLQQFQTWVSDNRHKVIDTDDLWCHGNETKPPHRRWIDLNDTVCSDYYSGSSMIQSIIVSDYLPMVIVTLAAFLIVIFLTVIMFIFRDPLRVWLYSRYGVRLFHFKTASSKHYGEDREKLYDGYVVYSPKDEEFVLQSIVAELEHGNPSFQLCLHYRDLPHHAVSSNSPYMQHTSPVVVEAAEASKRVILVLSRNFLQTEWSRFEFRSALHEALKGRIFKLVLVEESILPEAELDPDLRPYLKTGARIRWGEKRFWERLRYVMPSGDNQRKSCNYRRNINNFNKDPSVHRSSGPNHAYLQDKNKQTVSPSLQHHINNHPMFKQAAVANNEVTAPPAYSSSSTLSRTPTKQGQDDPNYSSATTATPSPRPVHRHHTYNNKDRPTSEHIYSSIDSPEYPTFERADSRRTNGTAVPLHHPPQPWRSGPSVVDTSGVQAYLV